MRSIRARLVITLAAFGAVLAAMLLFAPTVGSTHISLAHAFDRSIPFADNLDAQIFFIARLPRVVAAALCRRLVMLRDGVAIAAGPTEDVLTPDTVLALYGVDADIARHPRSGRLTVVPVGRV